MDYIKLILVGIVLGACCFLIKQHDCSKEGKSYSVVLDTCIIKE